MASTDIEQFSGVWVYMELDHNDRHVDVGRELLGEGRKLADELGVELAAVVMGKDLPQETVDSCFHYGADKVYYARNAMLDVYRTRPYALAGVQLVEKYKPEIFLIGATAQGRDFSGTVATILWTGLTADCTELRVDTETRMLHQIRPTFAGYILADIYTERHRPQMATVRPKVMLPIEPDTGKIGEVIEFTPDISAEDDVTRVLDFIESEGGINLAEADVIVSGGRGLGKMEGFEMLGELAELLGGAIGASRAAIDAGWIPYPHQVGQTGRTVRPKLYVACGISGAIQHLAGMSTAEIIIAINKDPDAPIFKIATYGIIGDIYEIVPMMIGEIKKRRG